MSLNRIIFQGLATVACITILHPSLALAQVAVNDVIRHFAAGQRPVQNVIVSNGSDNPVYVTVEATRVTNPGSGDREQEPTEDLIFSPKKFSIDPKGKRTVRLLLKKPPSEQERVYRVVFRPTDRGFGTTLEGETQGRKTVLKVMTGMGILVYVDPKLPDPKFSWKREDDKVIFTNNGNIHVRLFKVQHCPKPENNAEGECVQIRPRRVYGGKIHEIEAPPNRFVLFVKRVGASGEWESQVIAPG